MPQVSTAANIMDRAARAIVSADLTKSQKLAIREYFEWCCAYCGKKVRRGDFDHLDGRLENGPRNRVLSCQKCNQQEKRERPWREFLAEKCESDTVLTSRTKRIEDWVARWPVREALSSPEIEQTLQSIEQIRQAYKVACRKLREAVKAEKAKRSCE